MQTGENDDIFKELVRKYGDSILRLCYLYLKDYHLAEDAAQDTFLKVYRNLKNFRNESNIKTWITRIAINECKNCMRKNWFGRERYEIPAEIQGENPFDLIDVKESVTEVIQKLPLKYREVILLYYYQEHTVKEISEMLHLKESNVQQRLKRGREKLKTELKEEVQL